MATANTDVVFIKVDVDENEVRTPCCWRGLRAWHQRGPYAVERVSAGRRTQGLWPGARHPGRTGTGRVPGADQQPEQWAAHGT